MRTLLLLFVCGLVAGSYLGHQPGLVVPHELVAVFLGLLAIFGTTMAVRPSKAL